ncbi:hypothetical protein D770_16575 [Flammeovirgaceae bacterium 311]|nr:hypothetical protein D770_16575 [Flammeovirgaceae bacterium 311]
MKPKPLYIETHIDCPLEALWEHTQDPALHQLWDLRFTQITYLPKPRAHDPQRFLYSTKIGFGISVNGTGESIATKTTAAGDCTSVLKFWSNSPLSLIRSGSGYWKYQPQKDGVRFFTGYDYQTRWGWAGRTIDRYLFRPLMLWATAWSFDCLKNWLEKEIHPLQALRAQASVAIASAVLGLVWIYQGLVPKLLFPHTGELSLLEQSGLFPGFEYGVIIGIGLMEILFGCCLLLFRNKPVHYLNMLALGVLGAGAAFSNPQVLLAPFNPATLNLALIGLSLICLIHLKDLPYAANCKTKPL